LLTEVSLLLASYLIGSIPTGVVVGRFSGFDPRAVSSRNIGMTNVARAGGIRPAAITFLGDMLKGLIPVLSVRLAGYDPATVAAIGLAAFVGAICSLFLRFSGGKGVACSVGVWLGISPLAVGLALIVFVGLLAIWRIMSVSSMSAAIALVPIAAALSLPRPYFALAVVMCALILMRHHENIGRLIRGEEKALRPAGRDQRAS
jgi:glycerol-3-phosphate acyltransferase PlsY